MARFRLDETIAVEEDTAPGRAPLPPVSAVRASDDAKRMVPRRVGALRGNGSLRADQTFTEF